MATINNIPKLKGNGIFLGMFVLFIAGIVSLVHWGLAVITIVGAAIIKFNRSERRLN